MTSSPKTLHPARPRARWILRLLQWVLLFWVACPASLALAAGTIAVLDLDGYGVTWDTAQVMSQGVRDGFLENGDYDPIGGYQIADSVSAGHEAEIKQARTLLAEARVQMDAGNISGALSRLDQVLNLHQKANSWVARRPELADAHYFAAVAYSRTGRSSEALLHLKEALYLYPGYDQTRASNPPVNIKSLFEQARRDIDAEGPRTWSGTQVAAIGRLLGTSNVVAGYVTADGTLYLRLYRDGKVVSEATGKAPEMPLQPGDAYYADMAARIAATGAAGGSTSRSSSSTSSSSTSSSGGDFADVPALTEDEERDLADEDTEGLEEATRDKEEAERERKPGKPTGKIKASRGGIRYHKPVTQRWWFWTGIVAVAGGGGYLLYTVLDEEDRPSADDRHSPRDRYSTTVDTSDL